MRKTPILVTTAAFTTTGNLTFTIAAISPKGPAQKVNIRKSKQQKQHKVSAKNIANFHFIAF